MRPAVRSALSQVRSCSAVLTLGVAQGLSLGWTSPGLAKLRSGEGPFQPSLQELSWIASVFDLGLVLGVLVSAVVFSRLGRRQTILVGPVTLGAWIVLTYFGTNSLMLCAARLLAGASAGASMSFSAIYVAEVTTAGLRTPLILAGSLLLPIGILLAYSLGPLVSFRVQSLLPAPVVLLSTALLVLCMSESPFLLATRGRLHEMRSVLASLRWGVPPEEVADEAESIIQAVNSQLESTSSWRDTFSAPGAKRAALIVLVESGSMPLTGSTIVMSFTMQIFQAAGAPISPELCSSLLVALNLVMVLVAMLAIERLGRRMQLFLAAMVSVLAMTALAGYFLARDQLHQQVTAVTWVPMVAMFVFNAACGLGVNAVPPVLMGELLSERTKAVVAPAAVIAMSLISFALSRTFLLIGESVGFYLPFAGFAVANLLLALFTFFVVPETKGKTLVEVQEMLAGGRRRGVAAAAGHTFVFPAQEKELV